jgi:TolA-binding protein
MKSTDCDRRWEIDALREGRLGAKDVEAFERHARACDACAAVTARDEKLRALARSLADSGAEGEPNELALRRMRARVLHDVAIGAPVRRLAVFPIAAAFAVLALVSWTVVRRDGSGGRPREASVAANPVVAASAAPVAATAAAETSEEFAGTVNAEGNAQWSRERRGLVERVRLEDGALRVHVRHQTSGERFLVDLPDGELEVRGTTFEIIVHGGATERVTVEEGVVALRRRGHDELVLRVGESWSAPPRPFASGTNRPSAMDTGTGRRKSEPPSAPNDANGGGVAEYAAAVALMQSGRYSLAASEFHTFVLAHAGAPQAEDASFLEAASLARAGRGDAAALAAEDHLARFPKSFHRKEAAILVARAARDRGDCAQARAVLAPWMQSTPDDEVRVTLKKCAESEANIER